MTEQKPTKTKKKEAIAFSASDEVPILRAKELTKIFAHPSKQKVNYPLFANTTFEMLPEKPNFLVGPSGSGKTTFLKMLLGIEQPDAGELFLGSLNLTQLTLKERQEYLRTVGYMDQFSSRYLSLSLSVRQNLDYSLALYQKNSREIQQAMIKSVAEAFGLEDLLEQRTVYLSGGELRRLSVACSLIFSPKVLLCDEPTAQLDKANKNNLMELLKTYLENEKVLLVITTHDLSLLSYGAVYKIEERRIVQCQS
jgi:ABC-type multidrug transport system ATPase subunit